jgi:hypothetical protein
MRLLIKQSNKEFILENVELNNNPLAGKGTFYAGNNVSTIGKVQIEGIEDINAMVTWLLDTSSENRVAQQLRILKELGTPMDDIKYIKCLIDAVLDDIDSDHKDDIISSGLPNKVIYGKLTKRIKEYYQNTLQIW